MLIDVNQYYRILPIKQSIEPKLIALPGVTGVDVGLKRVGGEETPEHAILVFVAKKGVFEPQHQIPPRIEGIPTDVIEATFTHGVDVVPSPTTMAIDNKRYYPVQGGACAYPARYGGYGSLGMIVRAAKTNERLWLSCYHVLCGTSTWNDPGVDRRVVQPSVTEGGDPALDTIGEVVNGAYGQIVVNWGYDLYVDCAVCSTTGRLASSDIVLLGTPKGWAKAQINDLVQKYGATSEHSWGLLISTNLTVYINGQWFFYQYRVIPPFHGGPRFAQPGDSGSVTIDSSQRAIGLVMSVDVGGIGTTVNPMSQIIDALDIVVPEK